MVNRYSLSDYTASISNINIPGFESELLIGGPGSNQEGSFVGSIKLERATNTWETEGDPTGSWVHNKSLDRHGTVTISIRQVSEQVIRLTQLAQSMENNQTITQGCTIKVFDAANNSIATAKDCYIVKIPEQAFGEKAVQQDWVWTAGRITYDYT